MIDLIQGFRVGSTDPIDERFIIDNATASSGADVEIIPEKYFAINKDNGLLYVYDRESNEYVKASDFIDLSDIQYYDRSSDPFDIDNPTKATLGSKVSNIMSETGGSYNNYKNELLDANEIVKKSGLAIAFYHDETYFKLYCSILDADNNVIATSNSIDIPMENAITKAAFDDTNKQIIFTEISGATQTLDLQKVYDAFEIDNKFLAEANRAIAAEQVLTDNLNAESKRATDAESALDARLDIVEGDDTIDGSIKKALKDGKAYTDEEVTSENTRASNVEKELRDDLTKEIGDRTNAVSAEETRAKGVETKLNTDLDSEIDRAKAKEAEISNSLTAEIARAKEAEVDNKNAIKAEETRAIAKESEIATNLANEATRADTAEKLNAKAISDEETRAKDAEKVLTDDLVSESSRAKEIESSLRSDLTIETSTARSAESTLTTNLNSEINRATSSEDTLTKNLSNEVTRATGIESGLRTDLTNEILRAETAEKRNADDIDTEEARAKTAEAANTKLINDSIQSLDAVIDSTGGDRVNVHLVEVDGKVDSISVSENDIAQKSLLDSEIATAREAESKLNTRIDSLDADITSTGGSRVKVVIHETDGVLTSAVVTENDIAQLSSLNSEISRATGKEVELASAISAEETRAKANENSITSSLDSEISRAKAAEEVNATDIEANKTRIDSFYESVMEGTSPTNQLTNTSYVTSAIATASATFQGTYNVVTDLGLTRDATHEQVQVALYNKFKDDENVNHNDFVFVATPDATEASEIEKYDNYKCSTTSGVKVWSWAYTLNNSSFTSSQWAAINSGVTSGRLEIIETNISTEIINRESADNALSGRLDIIEGEESVDGSIKKALKDAKDYTNTEISNLNSTIDSTGGARVSLDIVEQKGKLISATITENDIAQKSLLDEEITRAKTVEASNTKAISDEALRAEGVEGTLSGLTTDAKGNLVAAINEVDAHVDTEVADRKAAIDALDAVKSGESARVKVQVSEEDGKITAVTVTENDIAQASILEDHKNNKANPHGVTAEQVGLGNCDNTSDLDKPVSTATQTELNKKVDKIDGYSLMSADEHTKLSGLENYDDTALSGRVTTIEGKESDWDAKYDKPSAGIPKADLAEAVQTSLGKADTALQTHQDISGKQDKITADNKLDYSLLDNTPTIPTKTSELTNDGDGTNAFLTQHQSLVDYRKATDQDTIDAKKVDKIDGKGLSTNDYNNDAKAEVAKIANKFDTPTAPTTEGTYVLKATVDASGNITYSWVAE